MRQMRVAVLLIAAALGGCSYLGIGTEPGGGTAGERPPVEKPGATAARPPLPVPPPTERPPAEQSSIEPPPPTEQPPPIAPERLVGLTEDQTRALIGSPAAVRDEPPAKVWTYGSAGCGLDVFFYLDLASKTFKALTYEVTPKGAHGLQGSACLASLQPAPHE